jgi:hypothetical protein
MVGWAVWAVMHATNVAASIAELLCHDLVFDAVSFGRKVIRIKGMAPFLIEKGLIFFGSK